MRRSGLATAMVLAGLVAGCTHVSDDSASSQPSRSAQELCRDALQQEIGSATATNVGTIRGWEQSPLSQPARNAFGHATHSAPAAWCWVRSASNWAVYGVGPDATSVLFGKLRTNGAHPPTGPPPFR